MGLVRDGSKKFRDPRQGRGVAALTLVIVLSIVALFTAVGVVFSLTQGIRQEQSAVRAEQALAVAEAGAEETLLRLRRGETVPSPLVLTVGNGTATVTNTTVGDIATVVSTGDVNGSKRAVEVKMEKSTADVSFFYGVQVSDGGLSMSKHTQVNGNVYSNGNIIGNDPPSHPDAALITGSAIVAGGIDADPQVEWTANDADHFFATASSDRDIAQSFTATETGAVPRISVYLGKVGDPTQDITLRLTDDNGNKPSTSSLASEPILRTSVGTTPSWISAAFASPVSVVNGTKYWIVLDYGTNNASNHWNWRKDTSDSYANNTGKYTSNWSSGSATWTNVGGDLPFRVWIGGANTRIEKLKIGDAISGEGRANSFVETNIRGLDCPNQYCIVESPPREELPISDGLIQDWRDTAAAEGVCGQPLCDASGDFKPSGAVALGPSQISGKMIIDESAEVTVTGTLWVEEEFECSNHGVIKLDPGYGGLSGLIVVDGKVTISNHCDFQGSGDPNSYIMLLSARDSLLEEIMIIDNNSTGVIYYAGKGRIKFSNDAAAKEATAYGITMDNHATITYEGGLASLQFSSGPGGGYTTISWREILPP